jgi:hypothetical protein
MDKEKKKVTNEKPVSLTPLGFREALLALVKVKPQSKNKKPKKPSLFAGLFY